MSDSQLYEETYTIHEVNSKKYDRVSRIKGLSPNKDTSMSLDVNTELYPISEHETIQLVLASTLALDGTKESESTGRAWREIGRGGEATLADAFDYVCRGRIYKFEEGAEGMLRVYISFGGLLLFLDGPWRKLTGLRMDYVYMLIKK